MSNFDQKACKLQFIFIKYVCSVFCIVLRFVSHGCPVLMTIRLVHKNGENLKPAVIFNVASNSAIKWLSGVFPCSRSPSPHLVPFPLGKTMLGACQRSHDNRDSWPSRGNGNEPNSTMSQAAEALLLRQSGGPVNSIHVKMSCCSQLTIWTFLHISI